MSRQLRDYQAEAVQLTREAWARGVLRPSVVLATGLGKTSVIGALATAEVTAEGRRYLAGLQAAEPHALLMAHRQELLGQMRDTCRAFRPDVRVGWVQGARREVDRPITVAMVPSIGTPKQREANGLRPPSLLITDECFPAGTLVGGVPIESIRTGDYVDSWTSWPHCQCGAESQPRCALGRRRWSRC